MTPLEFTGVVFGASMVAGVIGSVLGLGGGIIVTPVLTIGFGIDIRYAIGASLISVIATSSGAAAAYVREKMTNLRVAMLLEIATSCGALTGAMIAAYVQARWLFIIFAVILGYSAVMMLRRRSDVSGTDVPRDRFADSLKLHDTFYDPALQEAVTYRVTRTPIGFGLMYVAGTVSGLLGIGSGSLKVPAMDLCMRLPIKVSTATSNFMMGVTAAASAGVYFSRGEIDPFIAGPVAVGVLIGAMAGSKIFGKLNNQFIRQMFVIVLLWVSATMLWKGVVGK